MQIHCKYYAYEYAAAMTLMLITGINVTYSLCCGSVCMYVCMCTFFLGPCVRVFVSLFLSIICSCHLFVHSQFVNYMCRFYIASADLLTRKKTGIHFSNSSIFIRNIFCFHTQHATISTNVCVHDCSLKYYS